MKYYLSYSNVIVVACFSQRRIVEGTKVLNDVRFMAYLVKSEMSMKSYHGWTCGGAIISPQHILTAAACVIDVDHLYAIVGYNKYVSADALDDDACTRNRKKKVVKTCAPKSYNVNFYGWTNHDIGVAMLESPLDFTDVTYKIDCSYPPALIKVNFDPQYETPDTDVVAMGWGHSKKLRLPDHLQDHNEQFLQQASLLIVKREVCEKKFDYSPNTEKIVGNDIICVEGPGNLDVEGKVLKYGSKRFKCDPNEGKQSKTTTQSSPNNSAQNTTKGNTSITNSTKVATKETTQTKTTLTTAAASTTTTKTTENTTTTTKAATRMMIPVGDDEVELGTQTLRSQFLDLYDDDAAYDELFKKMGARRFVCRRFMNTRRLGLCQNDHGGPLIAWMGVNPIVIGVASTNLYNGSFDCISPNLFTSTTKNEWFIKCVVTDNPQDLRRCNQMALRSGQSEIYEKISDWRPRNEIPKKPRIDPRILPVVHLQQALDSYLQDYRNTQNMPIGQSARTPDNKQPDNQHPNKALSNFEKQLQNNHETHHNVPSIKNIPRYLQHVINYATGLPNQQHNKLRQRDVPNFEQNASNFKQHKPNQQQVPNYQQNIPNHQQQVPNYQQDVPIVFDYHENKHNHQQASEHQQIIPNHQQAPNNQHNVPSHQQQVPDYRQRMPDPRNHHRVTLLQLRPQKNIHELANTPHVTRPITRTRGDIARRKTLIWRRSVTRLEKTTKYKDKNQTRSLKPPHSGRSEFFVRIKV